MKRPGTSAILYLTLVFLSGILVGVVGSNLYDARGPARAGGPPSPEEMRKRYADEMRSRLKLRQDQIGKLDSILESSHERFRELREKYRPEVKSIQDDQTQKIRAILDDGQKVEYEKMREERERHRQPPPGGPRK